MIVSNAMLVASSPSSGADRFIGAREVNATAADQIQALRTRGASGVR
jgi:hypothetical protein